MEQLKRCSAVFLLSRNYWNFQRFSVFLDCEGNDEVDYLLRRICYLSAIKSEQIAKNLWLEIKIKIPSHSGRIRRRREWRREGKKWNRTERKKNNYALIIGSMLDQKKIEWKFCWTIHRCKFHCKGRARWDEFLGFILNENERRMILIITFLSPSIEFWLCKSICCLSLPLPSPWW